MKKITVNPDGVEIDIDCTELVVGASFFIPAVNTWKLLDQLKRRARRNNWDLAYDHRIEGGKWGIRVWRMS